VNFAPTPRWLKLLLLPVLAATAFCVDWELNQRIATAYFVNGVSEDSAAMIVWGHMLGPLLAAVFIAYPLARIYEADWKLACVGIVVPILGFYLDMLGGPGEPIEAIPLLIGPVLFAIFVPALAATAHRAMPASRLVVSNFDAPHAAARSPLALRLLLLPVLVVGFFIFRSTLQSALFDIGFLPTTRTGDRIGMLLASVLGPALLALYFAFPIGRIYGRHAFVVGAIVPSIALLWHRHMLTDYHLPWVGFAYALHLGALAGLPPLAAWWIAPRFFQTRLAIQPI
jgi:hypothetical protein